MPRKDEWPFGQKIEKLLLPISEKAPVVGQKAMHTTRRRAAYDMHFALEFGIMLSGQMEREYRDARNTIGPGGVWYCGIWEPHGWSVLRAPCRVVVLLVLPQAMARLRFEESPSFDPMRQFLLPPAQRYQPSRSERAQVRALGERVWSICTEKPANEGLWHRLLFQECLLLLNKQSADSRQPAKVEHAGRINRAIEAVYQHKQVIRAGEAADLCNMSKKMFNEIFTSIIGISFAKYALRYRLNGAATMLIQSEEPLKSIAHEWGFTDGSHFHRCFVQHYGCTPAEYREQVGK